MIAILFGLLLAQAQAPPLWKLIAEEGVGVRIVPGRGVEICRAGSECYAVPSPPDIPPVDPPMTAAPFEVRCNAAGVVLCDPLDADLAPVGTDATGVKRPMPNPDGSAPITNQSWWENWRGCHSRSGVAPSIDTETKASGSGSLRFDTNPGRPNEAGDCAIHFSDDLSRTFTTGETFYVQYRYRVSCNFLYQDCDASSPDYKTARRPTRKANGGPTNYKLSIIGRGDPQIGVSTGSCTSNEVVIDFSFDHALTGYHACGVYAAFREPVGSSNFNFQSGGDYECLYRPIDSSPYPWTWGYTGPNCWKLESDQWITIQVGLTPGRQDGELGHITVWASYEGRPSDIVIDQAFRSYGALSFGKFWAVPFSTGKDPDDNHPPASIWYDELIVSTQRIADP